MKKKSTLSRIDPQFKKELDAIKIERIRCGTDKKMRSDRRITVAMRRHDAFSQIKRDIINAKLEDINDQ